MEIKLTNLDKIYWPEDNLTKEDLINYYKKIASTILPYLRNRPQSMHRFPNGIKGKSFYQKNTGNLKVPSYVKTIEIKKETNNKSVNYIICQNKKTLIYLANLGCIEMNPWNSTKSNINKPDYIVIDLDPENISFKYVVETALIVKEILDNWQIPSYCKTSGATGLHIYIPLGGSYSYDNARLFAEIISTTINKNTSFTSIERNPAKRKNKVYPDYLQNSRGQTLVSPYSLRPRQKAPVSTPLKWEEVNYSLDPSEFNINSIFQRLKKHGDIFKPILGKGIDLLKILNRLT